MAVWRAPTVFATELFFLLLGIVSQCLFGGDVLFSSLYLSYFSFFSKLRKKNPQILLVYFSFIFRKSANLTCSSLLFQSRPDAVQKCLRSSPAPDLHPAVFVMHNSTSECGLHDSRLASYCLGSCIQCCHKLPIQRGC